MKKFFEILVLTLFWVSIVRAEWTIWIKPPEASFYIDQERIKTDKKRETVFFWLLTDLNEPKPSNIGTIKSFVSYYELDCKNNRVKRLQDYVYGNNMGSGSLLTSSQKNNEWKYPVPNSIEELLYSKTCNVYNKK